tara:strand:- start:921 stop:1109 length:189 start_codon:yes stop_codon:yes gene_type:complete
MHISFNSLFLSFKNYFLFKKIIDVWSAPILAIKKTPKFTDQRFSFHKKIQIKKIKHLRGSYV